MTRRPPRRLLVAGATAAAALALVLWATRSAPPVDAAGSSTAAATRPLDTGGPAPGRSAALAASSGAPAAPQPAQPSPSQMPPEWSEVPVSARVSDLGPLARDVYAGLQRARAAMEPCFEEDAKAPPTRPAAAQEDAWGAAIVMLQLEAARGELVVTGAPLQELGTSSMQLAECCERVLRGFRIPSASAVPGRRYRLPHQLTP